MIYATVSRGRYSFEAKSETEKALLQDFLGIKPPGVDLDTYVSKLIRSELDDWYRYWRAKFWEKSMFDAYKFVQTKYDEYYPKAPIVKVEVKPPEVPKVYVYKVLPKPPIQLKEAGVKLYEQLDDALSRKNVSDVLRVLREMLVTENSPIVVFGIVIGVAQVLTAIVAVLGSKAFSAFMVEETLQSIDFTIFSASQAKDWESEAKALAKKKEILDVTPWEQIISWIPSINLIEAVKKYVEVARLKYDIDLKLWADKKPATSTNPNVNLELASLEIEKGRDPSQYLPTTESIIIPEVLSGEVISVIDGDTIEIKRVSGEVYRVRLLGIDAPEFATKEGKASAKYLTDLIHGKVVTVEVDPKAQRDPYGRVLGRILYKDVDINKKMLTDGYAQYYFIGENKYLNVEEYKEAAKAKGKITVSSKPTYCKIYIDGKDTGKLTTETIELVEGTYVFGAVKEGYRAESQIVVVEPNITKEIRFELTATAVGEVETIEEVTREAIEKLPEVPPEEKFTIEITSTPANAKLYIDGIYTKHWTPSNERELRDVLDLLVPGEHTIRVEKAGMVAERKVMILKGANPKIHLQLETVGLPPTPAPPVVVEVAPPIAPPEVVLPEILKAVFEDMMLLTADRKVITRREVEDLKLVYGV